MKTLQLAGFTYLLLTAGCCHQAPPPTLHNPAPPPVRGESTPPPVATFSVVGFDPETGDLGVAVQSKFFGVGSVVPWVEADTGAIATQSYANTSYGPAGLALLSQNKTAAETISHLTAHDTNHAQRQVGIVDNQGRSASFTGAKCNPWAGHYEGQFFGVQGNLLTGPEVVQAMAEAFTAARQVPDTELADWLMASLQAGQSAGGDKRGRQSAALVVGRAGAGYAGLNSRYIDLRVEDHPEPIKELFRLLEIHKAFYASAHRQKPSRRP